MVEHGTVTADVSALVVVILVVCVLSLITRWVFKPSRPRTGRVVDATESTDLGMLDVLAADLSRADAMSLRAVLGDAGIRSSISLRRNGDVDVLVFHDDLPRARDLLR
jgi:ABC-type tungstate transport system permease subunit